MYRRILNLAALAIVGAGGSHLTAKPAAATDAVLAEEYCCTSRDGEFTCCGTLYCSSDKDSCTSRDRDES